MATHAHIGALSILDPSGCDDFSFDKVARIMAERVPEVPRFTMHLREVPFGLDNPYWVEDPDFDVMYHMHRIGVPSPGGLRELAELCGDLVSHKLDRRRPLWEMWFIEGLEHGRVGMLSKNHHCMIDGLPRPDPRPMASGRASAGRLRRAEAGRGARASAQRMRLRQLRGRGA